MIYKDKINIQGIDIGVVSDASTLRTVGLSSPKNSRVVDLATGVLFRKTGNLDTDWIEDAAADSELYGTYQPSGFVGKSNSSISYNDATRELTLTMSSQVVYVKGHRLLPSTQTVANADVTGVYYWYIDLDGNLQVTSTWNVTDLIYINALVAVGYWNAEQGKSIIIGDERHGLMDPFTHEILHTVFGSQYVGSGLGLGDFNQGKTNEDLDSSAQFSVVAGQLRDEDNLISLSEVTSTGIKKVLYRDGSDWKLKSTLDGFPVMQASLPEATGSLLNYNLNIGGVWSLAEAGNKDCVCCHVIATNGGICFVVGLDKYSSVEEAVSGARSEIAELFSSEQPLPAPENFPIASVIFTTALSSDNSVKAYIADSLGEPVYEDWRTQFSSSRGVSVSNHLELSNKDAGTYLDGGHTYLVPRVYTTTDPDTTDDSATFKTGTIWINNVTGSVFIQTDGTLGTARWRELNYYEDWVTGAYLHKGYLVGYRGYKFIVTESHIAGTNFLDNAGKVTPISSDVELVNSASHGLVTLDVVRYISGSWGKAQANSSSTLSEPPTVVIDHATNWFLVANMGTPILTGHGLTVDEVYYLSETTAGLLTTVESSSFSNPILKVLDANKFIMLGYRPSLTL